jgi:flagellar basal-body rod modification protein FlgD
MNVTSAASAGATSTASTGVASPSLGYNEFLQLLLTQMKNQDPLSPISSTEYIAQLATFSSVEQAVKQNAKLDELLVSSNLSQAGSVVGKTITSADGSMSGRVVSVRIDVDGATAMTDSGNSIVLEAGVTIKS